MEFPLISVLIPTYNVERYVESAIVSILNQSYYNIELIIVDDGSTDDTFLILKKLSLSDNRIRLFRNKENLRIVETLNFAIKQANGKFLARMDGDDISLPNRLEEQYKYLLNNPDIDLVGLNVIIIDEEDNYIHKESYLTDFIKIKKSIEFASPVPHFWLAKKELYDKVGPYRIVSVEDYDYLLRAVDRGFRISNLEAFLYKQRVRNGNTSTTLGLKQRKSIRYVKQLHRERLSSKSLSDSYSEINLNKSIKSTKFEIYMFNLSARCHFNYIYYKNKNVIVSIFFLLIAIMLSPFNQLELVYNRLRCKMIKLNSNKN